MPGEGAVSPEPLTAQGGALYPWPLEEARPKLPMHLLAGQETLHPCVSAKTYTFCLQLVF